MEALATLSDLKGRIDWDLDSDEERTAASALEDLSDDARYYGSHLWASPATAPRQVASLVLRAAARWLRNPDGYTQSRAGDETLAWTDRGEDAGSAVFTEREQKMLRRIAGLTTLHSVPVYAYNPGHSRPAGFVPVADGGKALPFFAEDDHS